MKNIIFFKDKKKKMLYVLLFKIVYLTKNLVKNN